VTKRDYYQVLGVSRHTPGPDLRRIYRRLARQYCPDVNLWDERAAGLFQEITEAYRVLGDPAARALYDRLGHRAFETPGPTGGTERPRRGEDLHCPVDIDFEEAWRGTQAVVQVTRQEPCPACAATGAADGGGVEPCPACAGRPVRVRLRGDGSVAARCAACGGTGWRVPAPCPACAGRGTTPRAVRLPVMIPAGVDTGAQLRIPAEGHAAPAPGGRGDLVVITRVRPHPWFTRKGDHLYCEIPVSVPEAALGARIRVPTPDGPAVVTIPPGTQGGQTFRLRARGWPRRGRDGRGDLLVCARVVIPRNTGSSLEEVLRTLQRLLPEDPRAELWGARQGAAR
jgi:molecular chaperone DnaJ